MARIEFEGAVALFKPEIAERKADFRVVGHVGVGRGEVALCEREVAGREAADAGVVEIQRPQPRLGARDGNESRRAGGDREISARPDPPAAHEVCPKLPQPERREDHQPRHRRQPVSLRDEDRQQRAHVQHHRRRDPARARKKPDRREHPRQPERGDQPEAQPRRQHAIVAQPLHRAHVVILKRVPEIPKFHRHQPQPRGTVFPDVGVRFGRPEPRYLRARERPAHLLFRHGDRVAKHAFLRGPDARRHLRITVGRGVVTDPEIDPAVRREHHRLARDEVIVQPRRRGPEIQPADQRQHGGGDLRQPRAQRRAALHGEKNRRQQQRHREENRGHQHRDHSREYAQPKPRPPPRGALRFHRPPHAKVIGQHQPDRGHQDDRKGLRRSEAHPAQSCAATDHKRTRRREPVVLFLCRRGKNSARDQIQQRGHAGIHQRLEQPGGEGIEATRHLVDGRQTEGVAGQTVEGFVISPLAVHDAQCPVAVKFHVVAVRDEMRRVRELNQNEKPDRKCENEDPDGKKARRAHAVRGRGKIRGDTGKGTVLWELYKQKAATGIAAA